MNDTMLIIDDSEVDRSALALIFQNSFDVLTASSAEQGLQMLAECNGNVDIILLDLVMPGMSGLDVLRTRLHTDYLRKIPVVVITASTRVDDLVQVFDLGGNDFITKPFISSFVVSRVQNVLKAYRRLESLNAESCDLRKKAETDLLTGLLNKLTAETRVTELLKQYPDNLHALMILDIDNFKFVNDEAGHQAGDQTLRVVADLLAGQFRKSDILGRIGGDEFMVLMSNLPSDRIVHQKVDSLVQLLKFKPNITMPANISISIGYVLTDREPVEFTELFRRADDALRLAKKFGKCRAYQYRDVSEDSLISQDACVVIISHNRSTSTALHSLWTGAQVISFNDVHELDKITAGDIAAIHCVYLDISDDSPDLDFLRRLLDLRPWLRQIPLDIICAEGRPDQYRQALLLPVHDILTAPLDIDSLRRRIERSLASTLIQE